MRLEYMRYKLAKAVHKFALFIYPDLDEPNPPVTPEDIKDVIKRLGRIESALNTNSSKSKDVRDVINKIKKASATKYKLIQKDPLKVIDDLRPETEKEKMASVLDIMPKVMADLGFEYKDGAYIPTDKLKTVEDFNGK